MPNFEVFDARIASALNKIIHNSHFKKKISLEEQKAQKEDRFLRGGQIAYLIYEQDHTSGRGRRTRRCVDASLVRSWTKCRVGGSAGPIATG